MLPFKYLVTLILICLLLSACATVEVGIEASPTVTPHLQRATNTATVLPVTPTPIPATPIPAPKVNQFYLGTLLGKPVLFIRVPGQESAWRSEPFLGSVIDEEGNDQWRFDLREIEAPSPILAGESEPIAYNFRVDPVTHLIYLSSFYINPAIQIGYVKNPIIEIDQSSRTQRQVWLYETGQDKYPGYKGGGFLAQAMGGFLVLDLYPCFACDSYAPRPVLIVNTTTGAEQLLGLVGDVQLKVSDQVVEYRRLEPTRQKCDPNPICEADGYMTIYEPAGEVISAPLP
jgi:hypothetical protein